MWIIWPLVPNSQVRSVEPSSAIFHHFPQWVAVAAVLPIPRWNPMSPGWRRAACGGMIAYGCNTWESVAGAWPAASVLKKAKRQGMVGPWWLEFFEVEIFGTSRQVRFGTSNIQVIKGLEKWWCSLSAAKSPEFRRWCPFFGGKKGTDLINGKSTIYRWFSYENVRFVRGCSMIVPFPCLMTGGYTRSPRRSSVSHEQLPWPAAQLWMANRLKSCCSPWKTWRNLMKREIRSCHWWSLSCWQMLGLLCCFWDSSVVFFSLKVWCLLFVFLTRQSCLKPCLLKCP